MKPNGDRQLVVAGIKKAETLNFFEFWQAYEDIVRRARDDKLTMDDFTGVTVSLTNPGGIGTVHSVPRLMPGQWPDHGRRRDGVPGGVPGHLPGHPEQAGHLQGHDADRRPTTTGSSRAPPPASSCGSCNQLLLGENDFYDEIFEALRIPYEPVRWLKDIDASARRRRHQGRPGLRADPLLPGPRPRHGRHRPAGVPPAQAPRPGHHRARAHPVGPGARVRGRRLRRQVDDEAARHPRRAARLVLPHHRHRVHAHPGPEAAQVDPGPRRAPARQAGARGAAAHPAPAERGRGVRDLPADEVRRPEALLAGGRRVRHPAARRGASTRPPSRASTRSSSAWPTAAG